MPNHSIQWMGASHSVALLFQHHGRLAPTADADRSADIGQ
jgi:hypothetical protein